MQTIADALQSKGVLIIAEIGCNHDGDLRLAKQLIDAAVQAGADAAKFQSFIPGDMITRKAPKANYQIGKTDPAESQYQRLERMCLGPREHRDLYDYCTQRGITFCSSCFDFQSADLLETLQVPFYKIPSGEITNLPLLQHVVSFGRPMIISTGMADLGEIEEALEAIGSGGRAKTVLLHCISDYPAPWHEANLRAIETLRQAFKLPVGFSDHTVGIELPLVAVGLGAVVIEKHITLDKNMEGGDHRASLEPHEFREMVTKIRDVEQAMGDGVKRCSATEENVRVVARKSIVSRTFIPKGKRIEADMLALKRPGTGIAPKYFSQVIGMETKVDIGEDHLITWDQLA